MSLFHYSTSLRSMRRAALASFALCLPAAASAQIITSFLPATAAAGSPVVITGLNLSTVKSVELNGQTMRISGTPTATSVSVIVPPAAATGRMRITSTTGTVLTGSKLGITRQSSAVSYGTVSTAVTSSNAAGSYSTPTMGDLDNDGRIEMIVGQGDGSLKWYEQTIANSTTLGTGVLLQTATGAPIDAGLYAKPTVTDLDGDGLMELLVGEDTGNVLLYEQVATTGTDALKFNVTTLFTNPFGTATTGAPNGGSYARPAVSDLDSDGLLDILVGGNDGTLRRYEQLMANANTAVGFKVWGTVKLADGTTAIDGGDVDKPLLTDYNGDGYLDMLLGNKAGNIMLYTQTALNAVTFTAVGNLTADGTSATTINMGNAGTNAQNLNGYAAPAITDIDGNGLLDLFVGNGAGSIYRYEQTQSATVPRLTAPLPVVLTAFAGQAATTGNRLTWTTAQEINSASFVVEASANGTDFEKVADQAAAGTSSTAHTYEYFDASAAAQAAARRYYRLRQVDLDGTFVYSPVVVLNRTQTTATATADAYPNPFTESLLVALPGTYALQPVAVALTTLAGQPVYAAKLQLGTAPQALTALPTLPAGVYVLRLTTASGSITRKVTRQ